MSKACIENRIYLAAFVVIFLITLGECSYGYGRVAESVRQGREQNEILEQTIADRDAAQARYDYLAQAAGEVAILEAGINYQQAQEAGNGR